MEWDGGPFAATATPRPGGSGAPTPRPRTSLRRHCCGPGASADRAASPTDRGQLPTDRLPEAPAQSPEDAVLTRIDVQRALGELSPADRLMVRLRYEAGPDASKRG